MFNCIKEYYRKKCIRHFNRRGDVAFINLKNISSVGFLYGIRCKEDLAELLEIHNFLRKKNIKFRGLAIECGKNVFERVAEDKKSKPAAVIPPEIRNKEELAVVVYENLSWIGVVDDTIAKEFFKQKFDLFICFNKDGDFTLDHTFATYVDSPMRVGMVSDSNVAYTMVMEGKEKTLLPVQVYLNQIFYYLDVIASYDG